MKDRNGVIVKATSGPGVLHRLTGVIAQHQGNITLVEIVDERDSETRIYFEIDLPG
jgi:energy-converting hydrogenase B subunit Q